MNKVSILIIDPEQRHRANLATTLGSEGYDVIAVGDAQATRNVVSSEAPDIILMDDSVNDLTFEGLLNELQDNNLDSFIIVMTQKADMDRSMEWIINGAFACFNKPISYAALKPALDKGLENKQALHEILDLTDELKNANERLDSKQKQLLQKQTALYNKTEQLRFLNQFSADLSKTLDTRTIVELTSSAVSQVVNPSLTVIITSLSTNNRLDLYTSRPLKPNLREFLVKKLKAELKSSISDDEYDFRLIELQKVTNPLAKLPPHGLIAPMTVAGKDCGVMAAYFAMENEPNGDIKLFLESVAMQAAQALYNAFQHESALEKASRDPLTGLYNRRVFEETLEREFKASVRHRQPLSLLMIDLDFFKLVNDRFGHQVGDEVLKTFSKLLAACARETDIPARFGGEEFVIILPNTEQSKAILLAERIQEKINQTVFLSGQMAIKQTISQGLADTQSHRIKTASDLLLLADQAMYQAKRDGRNTIRTHFDIQSDISDDKVKYA